MIFFENNNSKLSILVVMAVLTSVFIFYKYLKLNPIPEIANIDQGLITQISEGTGDGINEIKNNFEVGIENAKDIGAELKKENDRQALFEQAKEYAEEKLASSTATSTATSSPKEN
jgi:hypothetical protein